MAKLLRVGSQTYDLGPPAIIDGLFATISYRLEPDGRGSRFPTLMRLVFAGRMSPADAPAASRELEEVEGGLAALPPDRAVWSLSDLRRRDDSRLPVNRAAHSVRDYFVAGDGRPLLAALQEAIHFSRVRNEPVLLASSEARKRSVGAMTAIAIGLLWTALGYLFFRDWVLTTPSDPHPASGPLIWPLGVLSCFGGVAGLIEGRYPALGDWATRHVWLTVALVLAGVGVWMALSWQS